MEQKFLKCEKCGNIVAAVYESGVPIMCCGQKMQQIIPGSVEASVEKHIPVYEVKDNKVFVTVGSVIHPMVEEHFIEWISKNKLRKFLTVKNNLFAVDILEKGAHAYEEDGLIINSNQLNGLSRLQARPITAALLLQKQN